MICSEKHATRGRLVHVSGKLRIRNWQIHNQPMRFFNTEGPVRLDDHYAIAPLDRMDVEELLALIRAKRYFVLHAPRQTGKTSALIALRDLLNRGKAGDFRCVNVNVEPAQVARDNVARGIRAILSNLAESALLLGDDYLDGVWPDVLAKAGPENALKTLLARWCVANPTPLVLLVDEIDSLVGDTLLSVLRQLRAGYEHRPEGFPQSVVLCGVRDIRDYRIRSSAGEVIAGGSPFNVAAKSLRMGDFTEAETRALMAQHTEETGQRFSEAAEGAVWTQTCGQPWLVNALCAGACFDNKAGRDRSRTIEVDDVHDAREGLILSRPLVSGRGHHRLPDRASVPVAVAMCPEYGFSRRKQDVAMGGRLRSGPPGRPPQRAVALTAGDQTKRRVASGTRRVDGTLRSMTDSGFEAVRAVIGTTAGEGPRRPVQGMTSHLQADRPGDPLGG